MRRVISGFTACVITVGIVTYGPAYSVRAGLRSIEADRAIDAALTHAQVSGITYEVEGRIIQRSAEGDVAVLTDSGRVERVILREEGQTQVFTPYSLVASYARIADIVRSSYAIPRGAYVAQDLDSASATRYTSWFDPLLHALGDPTTDVVVDEAGRAVEVSVDGSATVRILRWAAPLAVPPAPEAVIRSDAAGTTSAVAESADFTMDLLKQLAAIANRDEAYATSPARTLQRIARHTGWRADGSRRGITITSTDALGATWRAVLVAHVAGVRVRDLSLVAHRAAMPAAEAEARMTLSIGAMAQSDLLSCPASCRMTGRPARVATSRAEQVLLRRLGSIGITGQTPGPDYPEVEAGMSGSWGVRVSGEGFRASLALSTAGYCLTLPIVGPGVIERPEVYSATPGSVGPWGTCQR